MLGPQLYDKGPSGAIPKPGKDAIVSVFYGHPGCKAVILREQDTRSKQNDREMIDNLHFIKSLGRESQAPWKKGDLRQFADLMNVHWAQQKATQWQHE